jgi:hypothetical protein
MFVKAVQVVAFLLQLLFCLFFISYIFFLLYALVSCPPYSCSNAESMIYQPAVIFFFPFIFSLPVVSYTLKRYFDFPKPVLDEELTQKKDRVIVVFLYGLGFFLLGCLIWNFVFNLENCHTVDCQIRFWFGGALFFNRFLFLAIVLYFLFLVYKISHRLSAYQSEDEETGY